MYRTVGTIFSYKRNRELVYRYGLTAHCYLDLALVPRPCVLSSALLSEILT